jgi:putative hydrolase
VKIIADLHTHTTFSHGKGSVYDNVTTAMIRGLQAVAIADHGPRSAPWVGASINAFRRMIAEVRNLDRRTMGLKVLAGAECNITSARGHLDLPLEIRAQLDIVLAGLHPGILPRSGKDWLALTGANWYAKVNPGYRKRARVANTRAVIEAVLRNDIDVVTHPGYHLDIDTVELARACAFRNTALEINARHHEMTAEFCRLAAAEGARFVINSDAHAPDAVGNVARGLAVARAAGLGPEQVLNLEGGGLFEWLRQKRGRSQWAEWSEQRPLDQTGQGRTGRQERTGRQPSYYTDWANQGKIH